MSLLSPLLLSCERASELIDRKEEGSLNLVQGWRLRAHLALCDLCKRYEKQSKKLSQLLYSQNSPSLSKEKMSDFKSRLKSDLKGKTP